MRSFSEGWGGTQTLGGSENSSSTPIEAAWNHDATMPSTKEQAI